MWFWNTLLSEWHCDGNLCSTYNSAAAPVDAWEIAFCTQEETHFAITYYILCLLSNCIAAARQLDCHFQRDKTSARSLARLFLSHLLNNSFASYCSPASRIMCFLSVHARCESDTPPAFDTSGGTVGGLCKLCGEMREKNAQPALTLLGRAPGKARDRQLAQHLWPTGNILIGF